MSKTIISKVIIPNDVTTKYRKIKISRVKISKAQNVEFKCGPSIKNIKNHTFENIIFKFKNHIFLSHKVIIQKKTVLYN